MYRSGLRCPRARASVAARPRVGSIWQHRRYGCRRHRGRRRARRPRCHLRAGQRGPVGAAARPRTPRITRRPGVLVPGRAVLRQLARAAAAADPGLGRAGPGRLAGQRSLRPAGGLLAAPLGRGVRAVRSRRAAGLAARARGALVPAGAVGRAGRVHRARATATRAPLPRHLGHRSRIGRAVLAAGAAVAEGADPGAAPGDRDRGGRRRRPPDRRGAGGLRAAPRRTLPGRRRREFSLSAPAVVVASGGIGGNFDLVRQNWPAGWGTRPAT